MAGGPGFEPGTKVPKTLVIPFHHPPTESTDPTGALTRGWCLLSPAKVYQRRLGDLSLRCHTGRRGAGRGPHPGGTGNGDIAPIGGRLSPWRKTSARRRRAPRLSQATRRAVGRARAAPGTASSASRP